jgi:hypothetical protein
MLIAVRANWQGGLTADPDHRTWADARAAEDRRAFEDWLDGPEGQAWLNAEIPTEEERRLSRRPTRTGYGLVLGTADLGGGVMIYLQPRMTLLAAAHQLRSIGLRLRWNIRRRALEIVSIQ